MLCHFLTQTAIIFQTSDDVNLSLLTSAIFPESLVTEEDETWDHNNLLQVLTKELQDAQNENSSGNGEDLSSFLPSNNNSTLNKRSESMSSSTNTHRNRLSSTLSGRPSPNTKTITSGPPPFTQTMVSGRFPE